MKVDSINAFITWEQIDEMTPEEFLEYLKSQKNENNNK